MSYTKTTWETGDVITAEKMNKIEDGVESAFGFSEQLNALIDGSITEITIPVDVTELCDEAFSSRKNLESVIMHDGVTKIGNGAFKSCTSLETVTISSGVTTIGNNMLANCTSLETVTIPSSVTTIGDSMFAGCTALKAITIPSSVTSIGNSMFSACTGLETVTIPSSVTSIGSDAFVGCTSLNSMYLYSITPPTVANGAFGGVPETCNIYVPAESVDAYKAASSWSARASYIQAIQE